MHQNILAIITARGGSKSIPRKNIRLLCGKPMITYTIEAALGSKYINRVVVSTEDTEIAEISKKYGAEIVKRPKKLAIDSASTEPVMEHAIKYLERTEDYKVNIVVLLQPTSPLRNATHIDRAVNIYFRDHCDSLLSVCSSHTFIWEKGKEGAYPINYNLNNRPRRQDKQFEYRENGAIYITKYDILMHEHNRLGGKIGLSLMPVEESWEIDTEFDFWLCEQLMLSSRSK